MTKTKNIKVQYSSRCTSSSYMYGSRYTSYPKIQMEGKWLEALGFHVGDQLQVEYEEGCIRITPAPQPVMMVAEPTSEYGKSRKRKAKA